MSEFFERVIRILSATANSRKSILLDGLTASVAAMNVANCAAIAQCSDQISDSLINGFYNLIQSDITTKKAESNTAVQTKSALLLEHSKAVQDKHDRMLTDVERERAKFNKVFGEPYLSAAASTVDQLGARSGSSGRVAAAGLRQTVSTVLQNLSNSLHNNLVYRHMMRDILWDKSIDKDQQMSYIPVAYCVFDDIGNAHSVYRFYAADTPNQKAILAGVNSYFIESGYLEANTIPDEELKLIDQAFSNMVQDSYSSLADHSEQQERVYTEICRLWKDGCSKFKQL